MKKIFAFAIAAVTMTVGCQKFQDILKPNNEPVDDGNPVEIKFSTNVSTVEVKGVGAVDTLKKSHDLYVYGIVKVDSTTTKNQIENAKANITTEGVNPLTLTFADGKSFFYSGTKSVHSFYGYYVDDACGKNTTPAPDSTYKLAVTIDGTQDILLGKANPSDDISGNGIVTNTDYVYSAWSARNNVKPNLKFEHALTQYKFKVQNKGTKDLALTAIAVTSKTKADLFVAGEKQGVDTASIGKNETKDVELKLDNAKKDLWTADTVYTYEYAVNDTTFATDTVRGIKLPANATTAYVEIKDASVMTFAAQENDVILYLKQDGMAYGVYRRITIPLTQAKFKDSGNKFTGTKAGEAYNIEISIYSLEQVEINVSLSPWTNVDLTIDQDNLDGNKDAIDDGYEDDDNWTPGA